MTYFFRPPVTPSSMTPTVEVTPPSRVPTTLVEPDVPPDKPVAAVDAVVVVVVAAGAAAAGVSATGSVAMVGVVATAGVDFTPAEIGEVTVLTRVVTGARAVVTAIEPVIALTADVTVFTAPVTVPTTRRGARGRRDARDCAARGQARADVGQKRPDRCAYAHRRAGPSASST